MDCVNVTSIEQDSFDFVKVYPNGRYERAKVIFHHNICPQFKAQTNPDGQKLNQLIFVYKLV